MSPLPPIETPSDLVRRAMREFEGPLVGFAFGIVNDMELARDIVQDTFVKLYEQDTGKISETGLKSWLYTVCRNRSLDSIRRRKKMVSLDEESLPELVSNEPSPGDTISSEEEAERIQKFVKRLPTNQQEVLRLKFTSDLSYKEISAVTGLSASNVGFLIHTALHRLRQMISPETIEDASPSPSNLSSKFLQFK